MRARTIVVTLLALAFAAGQARSEDAPRPRAGSISVGLGTFNTGHSRPSSGVGLEYRLVSHGWKPRGSGRFSLFPALGIIGSSKDALFAYAGLRSDLDVTSRWRLTPGFAVGVYKGNGDIDLGGPVEFRSSLAISRALARGPRLGIELYHISNARLYDRNPGINALVFVQTF